MKKALLFSILLVVTSCFGQNFTNGVMYDFTPGDTIVSSYQYFQSWNSSSPPTTCYRVIKNKTVSQGLDTIYYKAYDTYVDVVLNSSGFSTVYSYSTSSFYITNLNARVSFTPNNALICLPPILDTVGLQCNQKCYHKYSNNTLSGNCFEPPKFDYMLVEGVGSFYMERIGNSNPQGMGYETKLIAFHKMNGAKCGTVGSIPNGINEHAADSHDIQFYPNPSSGSISVLNSDGKEIVIKIISLRGELLYELATSEALTSCNTGIKPGIYFVQISGKNGEQYLQNKLVVY